MLLIIWCCFFYFQHYKKSLTASFDRYPEANYLVILEEDLDASVDILSYFKQLLPVLENDESLYCISAWNDQVLTLESWRWSVLETLLQYSHEKKWKVFSISEEFKFWPWDLELLRPTKM